MAAASSDAQGFLDGVFAESLPALQPHDAIDLKGAVLAGAYPEVIQRPAGKRRDTWFAPVLNPANQNFKLAQVVLKKFEEKFVGQFDGRFVGFQPVLDLANILEKPEISLDFKNRKFQLFFILPQS